MGHGIRDTAAQHHLHAEELRIRLGAKIAERVRLLAGGVIVESEQPRQRPIPHEQERVRIADILVIELDHRAGVRSHVHSAGVPAAGLRFVQIDDARQG